jgi:hypothetical protein
LDEFLVLARLLLQALERSSINTFKCGIYYKCLIKVVRYIFEGDLESIWFYGVISNGHKHSHYDTIDEFIFMMINLSVNLRWEIGCL